ncbi:hypothetical protein KO495_07200 [Colwellia sp. D2M02]|uniref:STAS/SEC14 domain-containing protein n=1 Tax=Colwellia asteriadis TaxID=517723 RepID=A0ABN1L2L0_9GAMM|nr:hypothetical protein [Colwellia sp. D2M02]MBU2893112.1 hypothetical protein [Colwellia sp. D2M02]
MQFSQHGQYTIEHQDNILIVDAAGPFNDETAKHYHQDITQLINELSGEAWGSLVTFHGNSIFTPDAEQQLIETTRYRQERGMIAIAVVITNSAYADIQQMQLQRIYRQCRIDFHVFSEVSRAKSWLNQFITRRQDKG